MNTVKCRVRVFDQAYRLEIGEHRDEELMIRWHDFQFQEVIRQMEQARLSPRSLMIFELPAAEVIHRKQRSDCETE